MKETHAMRRLLIGVVLPLLWAACTAPDAAAPDPVAYLPGQEVAATDALLRRAGGVLYHGEAPFSGLLVERYDDGARKRVTPYYQGRIHGLVRGWYPDGSPMEERLYRLGEKEGTHRGWWENGQRRFAYHFRNGRHEGRAREWFPNGISYRDFNYEDGKEAGPQRMWYEDGTLRANYVVKDGRRYGLIGAKPCTNPSAGPSQGV
jgi:antitoxin component YwqK of YwqJK toxin-antitoxin module